MRKHLDVDDILTSKQHGYRTGLSTNTALISLTNTFYQAMGENKYSAATFLDLSKAFDTIDHNILLEKLKWYGFRDHSYEILSNYLQNRTFHVATNGKRSEEHIVRSGVRPPMKRTRTTFIHFVH